MNKRAKSRRILWCLLPSFTRYSLILLLNGVFLSSVAATGSTSMQIAQQPETASQQAAFAAAVRLLDEGVQLYKQGTAESLQQALDKWKQTLPLWRQLGEKEGEAAALLGIGKIYSDLGDKQEALKYYNQSLPLSRQVGSKEGEASILNNIGLVYNTLGDKQQALKYFNQSLTLSRQVGNKPGEDNALNSIGLVYNSLGDKQQALNYFNQSLTLSRQVGNKAGEATSLSNIGSVYDDLGEKQQALNYYNQSLPLRRQVGEKAGEATTLNNIGTVYNSLGDNQQALNYFNHSLPLRRLVGDKAGEAITLNNIGLVYNTLGDKQQALKYFNQSLPLRRQVGDKAGEAITLNSIGLVYDNLGDNEQALNYYNQSLPLSRQVGDKAQSALTLNNIGTVYDTLGEEQQALNYLNQSLTLLRQVGNKAQSAGILNNIAHAERDKGNLQQALTQIQAAIKIIEDLRTKVDSQDLRTSYFASVQGYYKFYIDLLMQLHKQDPSKGYNAIALHISESSRARGLIELLTEAHADIRKDVDPKLIEEEKRLQLKIEATGKQIQELSSKPQTETALINFKKELETLLTQQKELQTKIRTNSPKYAALQYPQPLTLLQIQQQLDKDTLLLEYSLGEEHSYLWAVTPNSIDSYELPKREEIEKAATEFRDKLQQNKAGDLTDLFALSATKLSKLILAPVADKLSQKRLVIVADGALQKVPFTALTEPGQKGNFSGSEYQPLIVNHEIVNLPSVTTIASHRLDLKGRLSAPLTLAVLADPVFEANDPRITGKSTSIAPDLDLRSQIEQSDLKRGAKNLKRAYWQRLNGTRTEATAILKLVPNSQHLQAFDFDANYNWVTNKQLSQYRFLHFATHGFADPINPELSGIVLSLIDKQGKPADKGYLRLGDIFNLDFAADLVVLSACDTGLGKDVNGEGLVGLTRGLMYAGAERVAVSLWQVDDAATAELMKEFYTQMLNSGKSPTAALRAAQLRLWENSSLQNPYYWSAFTLQGEWR
jgi:CHAT domain-containing protein/Tfp pilus assembly protein PilF